MQICPYPPGIPLLIRGETISHTHAKALIELALALTDTVETEAATVADAVGTRAATATLTDRVGPEAAIEAQFSNSENEAKMRFGSGNDISDSYFLLQQN